eukprot:scaffold6043_cov315-Pinguiococcus_pyrenoidosus.AAC.4
MFHQSLPSLYYPFLNLVVIHEKPSPPVDVKFQPPQRHLQRSGMLSTAALLRIFWLCCFAVPLRSAESKKGRQLDPCGHLKVHIYLDLPRPSWIDNKATHDLADPRARGGALQEVGNASYLGVPCNVVASKALYDCPRMQYLGNGSPMDPAQTGVAFQRLWDTSNYAMPWFWTRYIFNNCWAKDPKDADLFYVALPIGELHPRTKVKAGWPSSRAQYVGYIEQVKEALRAKPSWQRCQGCDHFMVLGRWTSRFRDNEAKKYGSYRNRDIFWARVMKISYEGPAHPSLINTARPSVFHPKTDAEVDRWMQFVFSRERTRTATLIVRTRPWREKLINMCEKDDSCHLPDAERYYPRYDFSVAEYLNHTFSIHPGGEGCTRKAFFDR